jgi:ABC-type lipoprotein release transport system permease subunit
MASVPPQGGVWAPALAATALLAIAIAAAWSPARRAIGGDPIAALRAE